MRFHTMSVTLVREQMCDLVYERDEESEFVEIVVDGDLMIQSGKRWAVIAEFLLAGFLDLQFEIEMINPVGDQGNRRIGNVFCKDGLVSAELVQGCTK